MRRWDPFAPNAPWQLTVIITRRAGYDGTAELRNVMGGVDVSTALVTGGIVPCGHVGWFVGCLVGELGQFRGSVAVSGITPDHQTMLYGAAGARIGFEIPVVADRLHVRLAANLLGAPVRPRLRLIYPAMEPQTAWESAAFTGGLGAGLVAAF